MNRLLFLLSILWISSTARVQTASFRCYSVNDGVAQSQLYALLQDHQGYLWMGTRGGGCSRFDGKTFTTFSERNGLVNNYIYCLAEDRNKQIWIGTNDGLSRFNGTTFNTIPHPAFHSHFAIFDVAFDRQNTLWVATNYGVFKLEKNRLVAMNHELGIDRKNVYSLHFDKKQALWIGTESGLYCSTNISHQSRAQFVGKKEPYMRNAITCISEDQIGNLWFGTYGDGVYCFDRQRYFRIDLKQELYKESVFDIFFDRDGVCWIATLTKGVVRYQTQSFSYFNERQGLSNNHVRAIVQDNTGNLWFGTSGGGLCRYSGQLFTHYTTASGLGGNFVYSIFRDSRHRLWMGTSQNGVSMLADNQFTQYNNSNGFEAVKVKSICEDLSGNMYFGTEGQGVGMLTLDNTFQWIEATRKYYVRQMARHPDGSIWVATAGSGLIQLDAEGSGTVLKTYGPRDGILQSRLTSVYIDKEGKVWYGSESSGLGCLDPKTGKHFSYTIANRLPSNAIRCITQDREGKLWIGTAGGGVALLQPTAKNSVLQTIGLKNGLYSANVYLLTVDTHNNLIIGTESGLDVVSFSSEYRISRIKHYAQGDGFLGVETCQNSVWNDPDGKIWFGTINGMSYYNPASFNVNRIAPLLRITDVQLFYESLGKTAYKSAMGDWNSIETLHLPYDQNHLSFLFQGINLRNPDGVAYSWKMEGFDPTWSPWTKESRIVYSNMSPGNYTFLLRARNEDGYYNENPLRLFISIATPFWLTWWFKTFFVLGIVFLLWLIVRFQTKRIRTKALAAQQQAELAKNLVELEQKALRLQMNPHFIFNALNSIQGLIGTENETKARYYLAKFSRLMRQILDNSKNSTISLEEEIATLENYLLIEQFCNGNRFDYCIESQLETEANYIQLPPMLIQPFVENAIKHGFKLLKENDHERGQLSIRFFESSKAIECIIRDNGIGRVRARELAKNSNGTFHTSTGLNVTQERLDLLSENEQQHTVTIIDLYDENGVACGTEIRLTIPLQ